MKKKGEYSAIALFVDSPNMVRKEYDFMLSDIVEATKEFGVNYSSDIEGQGNVVFKELYFTKNATQKLQEASTMMGFKRRTCFGDADVKLAVQATEIIIAWDHIDLIAIATNDSDFHPVLDIANKYQKDTLILYAESCSSLQNRATHCVDMIKYAKSKKLSGNNRHTMKP